MDFRLWHCLVLENDLTEQKYTLVESLQDSFIVSDIGLDDEGVFHCNIYNIKIEDIQQLSCILDDDIVIYGCDGDIIMTKRTMSELGLG